jgi:DNA-binding winged helix-turn-helix (wHTH) protein/tetratricopeptide (TPR) repeat protein
MSRQTTHSYEFGPFRLDPNERLLLRDGQSLPLTPKAFEALLLLVENSGRVLGKQELVERLWPETFVEEANLTNNISLLRKALGDSSEEPHYIETVPRRGYRFVAAVKQVQPAEKGQSKWLRLFTERRPVILTVTVAAVFILLITVGGVILTRLSRPPKTTFPFHERDWVLIANFENRTGEPLFDGTIESALERELSNSRFVSVTSPERAGDVLRLMKKPPGTKIDAALGREICLRDGGIRALLTGRLEKLGTTYVMGVNLIDPYRNRTVASASEEAANQESLWPAIRRLSNWTRETLGETLTTIQQSSEALEKVTTPSLRALQLYTQAMPLVNEGAWPPVVSQGGAAERVLRQALTEDPEFASAYIMLAHMIRNRGKPEEDWGPPSQRALDLSGQTSERERYFIEGSYYTLRVQPEKAVSAYEALVRQYPDHFWGRNNLAWAYFYLGRWQEYITQFAEAAELRPNDLRINRLASWNLLQRDMNEARRVAQRAAKVITPEMATAHPYEVAWIQLFPVHDLWVRGDIESALNELDRWAQTVDSREGSEREAFAVIIGSCYLSFGKLRAAEEFFQRLPEKDGKHNTYLAEAAFAAGDRAKFRKHVSNLKPYIGNAMLLARAGFRDEAQKLLSERKKSEGSETELGQIMTKIVEGEIALFREQTTEAISLLQEAVPMVRYNSSFFSFIESESLADALERQGDQQKAVQVLERASQQKAIAYENDGSTGQYWLRVQWRLAQLYRKLGRVEDAEKIEAELSKMLAYADPEHPILLQLKQARAISNR